MQERKSGWENVDVSSKAEHYIYLMDKEKSLASVQRYTAMTYAMLELKEGSSVVDVGCGTASDAINLYNIVGPQGKVVGVDYSQKLIDEAKKRVAQANLPIDLCVGDAHQLTMFAGDSFDAARATAVFHHLQDPAVALQEMIRIVRPGGDYFDRRIGLGDFADRSSKCCFDTQNCQLSLRSESPQRLDGQAIARTVQAGWPA